MKLRWTQRARRDLLDIRDYIARDKLSAAQNWIARLRERARQAADAPLAGRKVPEIGRDDIREILERDYRIVYRILENEVHILTVFEGHRRLRSNELDVSK